MPERIVLCQEKHPLKTTATVHPGWIRATSILLVGMERLRRRESGQVAKDEEETRR